MHIHIHTYAYTKPCTGGGVLAGLARKFLTGESLFFQELRAEADDQDCVFAASYPGDVVLLELDGTKEFLTQKGAFLCGMYTLLVAHFLTFF